MLQSKLQLLANPKKWPEQIGQNNKTQFYYREYIKGAGSRNVNKLLSKRRNLQYFLYSISQRFSIPFLKIKVFFLRWTPEFYRETTGVLS